MKYNQVYNPKVTPQKEQAREDQVANNAGGYVFDVGKWEAFKRFLILGTEGGTYYVGERKLTQDAAKNTIACIKEDGQKAVELIVQVSDEGRAVKNAPAVFALAIAAGDGNVNTRRAALNALPKVARTGTDLFAFVEAMENFRGWGRLAKNAVAQWFTDKDESTLAYQVMKYQQREGWSMADLLRLSHPVPRTQEMNNIFKYVLGKDMEVAYLPSLISAYEEAKTAGEKRVIELILSAGLTREMIPTQHLNSVGVWDALLQKMPLMAMVRNLGKMSNVGLLKPLSKASSLVVERLNSEQYIRKSRLHPLFLLTALRTYQNGRGDKGSLTWQPVQTVVQALEDAFYLSFGNVEPTGKRMMISLDVSGSMGMQIAGSPLSCAEASVAMALVTARVEKEYVINAFTNVLRDVPITNKTSLQDAIRITRAMNFGSTDCALPMVEALKNKLDVDVFSIYTDSETWYGGIHPFQALKQYRQARGIAAKQAVVAMTATQFSIADPNDPNAMDFVGFSTDTPAAISEFARM